MKRILLVIVDVVIMLLFCVSIHAQNSSYGRHTIRFIEPVTQHNSQIPNVLLPSKSERNSSRMGSIKLLFDESVSDSVRNVFEVAARSWEAKLPIEQVVNIFIEIQPLESEVQSIVDVAYYVGDYEGSICYPLSLALQIIDDAYTIDEDPGLSAYIALNSNLNWNCSYSANSVLGYNLLTTALRSFALAFGFGSSVAYDTDKSSYYFLAWPYSVFDCKVHNDSQYMIDIPLDSECFSNFVSSDNLFVEGSNQDYKLYSDNLFVSGKSLVYLNEPGSLMHYNIGEGNKSFAIDSKTLDVLQSLGWNMVGEESEISITCVDISSDGIGSSYSPHVFSLDNNTGEAISEYLWHFYLKNINGDYTEISTGSSSTFVVPCISSTVGYFINLNGDLEGKIECEALCGGHIVSAKPFALSLELKPEIVSIEDIDTIVKGENLFALSFKVKYRGADRLNVYVEEEYSSTLRSYRIDEPYFAHVLTGNISSEYYSWVDIKVTNQYGTVTETLEFEPQEQLFSEKNILSRLTDTNADSEYMSEVYNSNGIMLYRGNINGYYIQNLASGLYFVKQYGSKGEVLMNKIVIR